MVERSAGGWARPVPSERALVGVAQAMGFVAYELVNVGPRRALARAVYTGASSPLGQRVAATARREDLHALLRRRAGGGALLMAGVLCVAL